MEKFDTEEFPGFQTFTASSKPPLSRLQRHAPLPLQLKPAFIKKSINGGNQQSSSSSSSSSSAASLPKASFFSSKDPIPLLSPLVLPSMLEPQATKQETMATSAHIHDVN